MAAHLIMDLEKDSSDCPTLFRDIKIYVNIQHINVWPPQKSPLQTSFSFNLGLQCKHAAQCNVMQINIQTTLLRCKQRSESIQEKNLSVFLHEQKPVKLLDII